LGVEEVSQQDIKLLSGASNDRRATLNRLLFPAPFKEFSKMRESYGRLDQVDTIDFCMD
jgi:Pyruvate carboxylase